MRLFVACALTLTVAVSVAAAQTPQRGSSGAAPSASDTQGFTPAPMPAVPPPTAQTGGAAVPEQVAPPGVASGGAGPQNATPFSAEPSGLQPPSSATPGARGTGSGALAPDAGNAAPNLSR